MIFQSKLKEHRLVVIWFLLSLCILANIIVGNVLSIIAFCGFLFSAIFVLKTDEIIPLLFGLMPFANIFKLSPTSMSLFTICEIVVVIIITIRNKKINSFLILSILLMIIYLMIFDKEINFTTIIKIIVGFLLINICVNKIGEVELKKIAILLAIGVIVSGLLSISKTYFGYLKNYFTDLDYLVGSGGEITGTMRISGFLGDPNYYSVLIIINLVLLGVLYFHKRIKISFWVLSSANIILGFFTYSKSYFLCLLVYIILFFIFVVMKKNKKTAFIFLIGILIIGFLAFRGRFPIINRIIERFSSDDVLTGRDELNLMYLEYIFDNPKILLFGEGISSDKFLGAPNNVHNIYIELIFKLGIVGAIVYFGLLSFAINIPIFKFKTIKFVNFFPLMFFLVMMFFLAGINRYELPYYIIICFTPLNFNRLIKSNNERKKVNI